ncbi:MAG: ferredoxin--NADP(+) reductase [Spirochaetia bacterium]|nr:ferredoxin--NADP(+) reductase [Spirochaetia bacterium]
MSEVSFKLPEVIVNQYRKAEPLKAVCVEKKILVEGESGSDVCHIVFDTKDYKYKEGQSAPVIPPGENEQGKAHNPRLYSIASMGNDINHNEKLTLCVRRVVYNDESTGKEVKGVCSNYLCDLKEGDEVLMTGPSGRKYLLPDTSEINRPYVFLATGTGIAPFRGMIDRLLNHTPEFNSPIYLFFGARYKSEMMYEDEFSKIENPNFHYIQAISREQKNKEGGRMYVHHRMIEMSEELAGILQNDKTIIYLCGLKGMEEGIEEAMQVISKELGESENYLINKFQGRILKEVY